MGRECGKAYGGGDLGVSEYLWDRLEGTPRGGGKGGSVWGLPVCGGQALTALEVGEYVRETNGSGVKEELKGRMCLSFPTGSSWIRNWARLSESLEDSG